MGSSVVTPEDVLESLMNDGTIDAIRMKIINQLKANEELKNNTISMVEQSKVLSTAGAEKQTKRELFDALRHELETPVLEKASKAVWELILDNDGLGKEISDTVERMFCRLSGREPPPIMPPLPAAIESQHPEKVKESKEEEEEEKVKEVDVPDAASSRKRAFSEMDSQGSEVVAVGAGSELLPVKSEDCMTSSSSNPKA